MSEIIIKNPTVLRMLMEKQYDENLIDIICFVADEYGFIMTEAWRLPRHSADVHATDPGRGSDLRYRIYKRKIAYEIMDKINDKWAYDPGRAGIKCCIIHGEENNKHLHIQTHQNTIKR